MSKGTQDSSSLSDEQWQVIKDLLPKAKTRGSKPIDRRQIIDSILCCERSG